MYLHLGAAPDTMRARELGHSAVLEILRPYDQPERLQEALRAELGSRRCTAAPHPAASPASATPATPQPPVPEHPTPARPFTAAAAFGGSRG